MILLIQNKFFFCLACILARWLGNYFEGWQSASSLRKKASLLKKKKKKKPSEDKFDIPFSNDGKYVCFSTNDKKETLALLFISVWS